jgi:hypothetical protein
MKSLLPIINFVIILSGIGLHTYTLLSTLSSEHTAFSIGLMLVSIFPYCICLLLSLIKPAFYWVSFGGALAALVIDALTYHSVFISPQSSTAALGLLFAPLWNLFLLMPIEMVLGYGIKKSRESRRY